MEIWVVNKHNRLSCLMDASSKEDADNKMIELAKKYPDQIFIIANHLVARRVVAGKVVNTNVYG